MSEKQEFHYFTFGDDRLYKYVKIEGDWDTARNRMVYEYGRQWGFQYNEEDFQRVKKEYNLKELKCFYLED